MMKIHSSNDRFSSTFLSSPQAVKRKEEDVGDEAMHAFSTEAKLKAARLDYVRSSSKKGGDDGRLLLPCSLVCGRKWSIY